jgi:membrane protease YdiL (CAAX protease family)
MSKKTLLFIISVLLSTWIITLSIKHFSLSQQPMTVVMIIPMLLALVFILTSREKKLSAIGWHFPRIRYFLISIFLPILQMSLVVSLGFSLKLLSFNYHHIVSHKPTSNIWLNLIICIPAAFIPFILLPLPSLIVGWLNHLGEEFAWRGYLFRNISKESNNLLKGAVFTGFVWWAWHLPMFWISPVLGELSLSKMGVSVLLSFFSIT